METVRADPALDPADVGAALVATRAAFDRRAVILAAGRDGFLAGLQAVADGDGTADGATLVHGTAGDPGQVAFVFPGQGSQWAAWPSTCSTPPRRSRPASRRPRRRCDPTSTGR
ncbi:hypothetical protein ACFQX6_00155 [Streptosporangium lutulentum]